MDADTTSSGMFWWLQSIDPGHYILEVLRPALNIFRSETFAPDLSLAMIVSAIVFAIYFRYFQIGPAVNALNVRAEFLRKCTTNKIFTDNFYEFDLLMKEEHFLEHVWTEFVETCILRDPTLNPDVEITVRPSDFINIDDCENSGLSIKWFHGLSAIYVGFGLLFTFVGLVAALFFSSAAINAVINANTAASAAAGGGHDADVQRALAQLLNTATFKFLTSIAGLGCSIVLAFVDRRWRSKIERGFDQLCRELERCTVMVTPESIADRQYRMLGDIAEALRRLGPSRMGGAAAVPAAAGSGDIKEIADRLEAVVVASSQALANSFEQSLARHAPPPPPPPPPIAGWREAATRIEATLAAAAGDLRTISGDTHAFKAELSDRLGTLTAALRSDGEQRQPAAPPDTGWREAAARIEATLAAAAGDLRAISSDTHTFKAELSDRLGTLTAALRSDGEQRQPAAPPDTGWLDAAARIEATLAAATADLRAVGSEARAFRSGLEGSFGALITAIQGGFSGLDRASSERAASAQTGPDPGVAAVGPLVSRLGTTIDRLTDTFEQMEGKLAVHVAAFDGLARVGRETEQAMSSASAPLLRVGTEISGSVAAMTAGVDASVRALVDSQQAGERLAEDLRATCGALHDTWSRHEGRFVAVDESVARILAAIIQHTETHGETVRNHFVAIDSHLAHAVTALASNIEALQEVTSDLTEAVNGTNRQG